MDNVISLVLGGGRGTRLYPLTKYRSKPAVPVAGRYRLIDIPLSNCINSGVHKIYVLTQFNSVSLHRHIRRTYNFDVFHAGYVEILAAQQTNENLNWYQGTADAVRQNLRLIEQPGVEYVLILSGDQLYRMDFRDMLASHQEAQAGLTIAALPISREETHAFGCIKASGTGQITGFKEKPKTPEELKPVLTDAGWLESQGYTDQTRDVLVSMGIYLFDRERLIELLRDTSYTDFGKEVFPAAIERMRVQAHLFDDYWEDIGTVRAYYEANLELAKPDPKFHLPSSTAPLYTRARFLPPSQFNGVTMRNSLVAEGCHIGEGTVIENSVIGLRCQIGRNVTIRDSIVLGLDFYETPKMRAEAAARGEPILGIGDNTLIEGAIIDKNIRIGKGCRIVNDGGLERSEETDTATIVDGVLFISKEAVLPDGWEFEPVPAAVG